MLSPRESNGTNISCIDVVTSTAMPARQTRNLAHIELDKLAHRNVLGKAVETVMLKVLALGGRYNNPRVVAS